MYILSPLLVTIRYEPVYQALWAKNDDFDEILISPVMIQDHMPEKLVDALERLLINVGPPKPKRKSSIAKNNNDSLALPLLPCSPAVTPSSFDRTPSHRVILETSFADLQPSSNEENDMVISSKMKSHKPSLFDMLRHSHKLDLLKNDWKGNAPLASPETLSDASSLSSHGPPHHVKGCVSVPPKMDAISQSPPSMKSSLPRDSSSLCSQKQKYITNGSGIDLPKATSTKLNSIATTATDNANNSDSMSEMASTRHVGDNESESSPSSPSAVCEHESQVSLQDLIEAFSSGKSSPKERHVSFSSSFGLQSPSSCDTAATFDSDNNKVKERYTNLTGRTINGSSIHATASSNFVALNETGTNSAQGCRTLDNPTLQTTNVKSNEVDKYIADSDKQSHDHCSQSSGNLSPASHFLFQKLLTLESSSDDECCD